MADKPILFSAPMVQALLDGRKMQTRRIIKDRGDLPQFCAGRYDNKDDPSNYGWQDYERGEWITLDQFQRYRFVPHRIGDRLWTRECFAVSGIGWGKKPKDARGGKVHYRADPDHGWQDYWGSWRPSIHMPRWASRLTLIVTDVRVQRLGDISNEDAIAEGIKPHGHAFTGYGDQADIWMAPYDSFKSLWNSINGPEAWDANPWVAAYSFRVIRANIDSEAVGDAL